VSGSAALSCSSGVEITVSEPVATDDASRQAWQTKCTPSSGAGGGPLRRRPPGGQLRHGHQLVRLGMGVERLDALRLRQILGSNAFLSHPLRTVSSVDVLASRGALSPGGTSARVRDDVLLARELAVGWAARAAVQWHESGNGRPGASNGQALLGLGRAQAELGRLLGRPIVGRGPAEFLSLLRQPLGAWLPEELRTPGDGDIRLLDDEDVSADAELLALEYRTDPDARFEAEVVERRVADVLFGLPMETYPTARRFLIEHQAGPEAAVVRGLTTLGFRASSGIYEPVPAASVLDGCWWPCPSCGWPMRVEAGGVACRYRPHRAAGASYLLVDRRLHRIAPSRAPVPEPAPVAGACRLSAPVWRFIAIPGLAELDLAERIGIRMPDAKVDLWPDRDAADVRVDIGGRRIDADVKDWSDPVQLLSFLLRRAGDGWPIARHIVVPDHRRRDLRLLNEGGRRRGLATRFESAAGFLRRLSDEEKHDR
jgi:REase associating with pPIWI_RE